MITEGHQPAISRRKAIGGIAVGVASGVVPSLLDAAQQKENRLTSMGVVIYDCNYRRKWMRQLKPGFDLFEPMEFLKHCHDLGAGGIQAKLGELKTEDIRQLRDFAEKHDLFIDAIVSPPKDDSDNSRFEAEIKTAKEVGVLAARTTIIPGRRYERFKTLAEFHEFEKRGKEMLERAVSIVEKYQIPLAVENHKDQRLEERIALFKHLDCEFIGACVDTGNSFALLDGAYEPIEELAPYAMTVHLKDQALQQYDEGFLLGDIPLGQGSFDLKSMVQTIRKAKPDVRFTLELITRNPLKVPCFTEQFYATMPEVKALDLAKTMKFVIEHSAPRLQYVDDFPLKRQVAIEDANVIESLRYAGRELGL